MNEKHLKHHDPEFLIENESWLHEVHVGQNGENTKKEWLWECDSQGDCGPLTMGDLNEAITDIQNFLTKLIILRDQCQ